MRPELFNSEGDEIVFHEVVFPLTDGATPEAIGARLEVLDGLEGEGPQRWTWTGPAPGEPSLPEEGLRWNISTESGRVVLGSVALEERTLTLSVNSAARAERGRTLLQAALARLTKPPLTEIRTLDQAMADHDLDDANGEVNLPPELERELVHGIMDAVLDEPVPALGGVSPRAAVKTAKGRTRVAAWLKTLENGPGQAGGPDVAIGSYDFTWMWRELDILSLRK